MQFMTCDVNTYCIGICASMGSVLLTAGTKGKRFCLPNSHVMIHQVSGGASGTASDVERTIGFMFNLKKRLNGILAHHTGKTVEQIEHDSDRDNYMSAEDSVTYGLVDKVLTRREMPDAKAYSALASAIFSQIPQHRCGIFLCTSSRKFQNPSAVTMRFRIRWMVRSTEKNTFIIEYESSIRHWT
jgi:hypothetical protein